ncbi:MAG: ABC transporter ATP-binding protein, partial [Firmicutes bacterium]|nr:ABC transporter ATP-binding protein [Bacillota bacterium]
MKFMFSYLSRYKGLVAVCMISKFIGTVLELLIPYVLEYMIDSAAPTKNIRLIIFWGIVMLALAALVRFVNVFANRL